MRPIPFPQESNAVQRAKQDKLCTRARPLPPTEALKKYNYYQCYQCGEPYCGGRADLAACREGLCTALRAIGLALRAGPLSGGARGGGGGGGAETASYPQHTPPPPRVQRMPCPTSTSVRTVFFFRTEIIWVSGSGTEFIGVSSEHFCSDRIVRHGTQQSSVGNEYPGGGGVWVGPTKGPLIQT